MTVAAVGPTAAGRPWVGAALRPEAVPMAG